MPPVNQTKDSTPAPLRETVIGYVLEDCSTVGPNVRHQMAALRRLGATVLAFSLSGENQQLVNSNECDKLISLDLPARRLSGTRIAASVKLRQALKKEPAHYLICDQYKAITTACLATTLPQSKTKIIALLRGFNAVSSKSRRRFYRFFNRRISAYATLTHAQSNHVSEQLHWADSKRFFTINNYLDHDNINASLFPKKDALHHLGLEDGVFTFGTICRFDTYKRLIDLVNAAAHLKETTESFRVIIIGDGREKEALESAIEKNGLENHVFLTGLIKNGARYLRAFDCFVFPSIADNFARVLLEARSAEIPILAVDAAGTPEVVGPYAFLASPKNPADLSEKMNLIKNTPKEDLSALTKSHLEWSRKRYSKENLENNLNTLFAGLTSCS